MTFVAFLHRGLFLTITKTRRLKHTINCIRRYFHLLWELSFFNSCKRFHRFFNLKLFFATSSFAFSSPRTLLRSYSADNVLDNCLLSFAKPCERFFTVSGAALRNFCYSSSFPVRLTAVWPIELVSYNIGWNHLKSVLRYRDQTISGFTILCMKFHLCQKCWCCFPKTWMSHNNYISFLAFVASVQMSRHNFKHRSRTSVLQILRRTKK